MRFCRGQLDFSSRTNIVRRSIFSFTMKGFTLLFLLFVVSVLALGNVVGANEFVQETEADGEYEEPESPLFQAASAGNYGVIEHELANGADANVRNDDGWTPLMFAVESNSLHAISLLLRSGADVNVQDKDGWCPLMFAAHAGKAAVVRMLLEANANVLLANKDGFGAHSIAHFEGHKDISNQIATRGVVTTMVTQDFATMQFFIKDGASVNTRNSAGWTPLIAAISAGNNGVALALLDRPDIDVNLGENDGWTPLMFAANNNRFEVAARLLELGADLSIKSRLGLSAQGIARDRSHTEISALFKTTEAARTRAARLAEEESQRAFEQQNVSPADYTLPESVPVRTVNREGEKQATQKEAIKSTINKDKAEAKKKKAGWFW